MYIWTFHNQLHFSSCWQQASLNVHKTTCSYRWWFYVHFSSMQFMLTTPLWSLRLALTLNFVDAAEHLDGITDRDIADGWKDEQRSETISISTTCTSVSKRQISGSTNRRDIHGVGSVPCRAVVEGSVQCTCTCMRCKSALNGSIWMQAKCTPKWI